ncbi:MAG TPA: hypothetical protein VID27_15875 [Blastocatellia bacterium]
MEKAKSGSDLIDVYEQMLFERAARGIRPVLYISSNKDLECSVLMLLDEPAEDMLSSWPSTFNTRIFSQPMRS